MEHADLIYKHFKGTLTPEEKRQLEEWLSADERNRQLLNSFEDPDLLSADMAFFDQVDIKQEWKAVSARAGYKKKFHVMRWSAAAAIVLAIGLTWALQNKPQPAPIVKATPAKTEDIQPGSNKAVLQLANGQTVTLGDNTDTINEQNGASIQQQQGQLVYNGKNVSTETIQYNMLTTPRGGQYQLKLEDGTMVWLNASSSLRFPVKFTGKDRVVELTGEGYFEVAKNAKPFFVKVNGMEVAVLGTHFNVMAYEGVTKTTLTEGAVKIRLSDNRNWQLVPGQQATVAENREVKIVATDIEKALAWKNGIFYFKDDDLKDIMEQVARWYDIDIKIKGTVPAKKISGNIRRQAELSQVLDMLNFVSNAKFNIEGRTVHVSF